MLFFITGRGVIWQYTAGRGVIWQYIAGRGVTAHFATRLDHLTRDGLCHQKSALQVDANHRIKVFFGHL